MLYVTCHFDTGYTIEQNRTRYTIEQKIDNTEENIVIDVVMK